MIVVLLYFHYIFHYKTCLRLFIDFLKWRNRELMRMFAWRKVCFFSTSYICWSNKKNYLPLINTLGFYIFHLQCATVLVHITYYFTLLYFCSLFLYGMQDTEILFLDNSLGMTWTVPYGWTSCSTALTAQCKHNSLISIWLW